MSGGAQGEKTEAPTPKKLKDARKEGQVGRSNDLGAWLGVAAAGMVLPWVLAQGKDACLRMLARVQDVVETPEPAIARLALSEGLKDLAIVIAPLAAVCVAVAIGSAGAQGGIHPATKALKPKMKRMSPKEGFKRILGPQAMWEAVKATLKTAVLGGVLYWVIQALVPTLLAAGTQPLTTVLGHAQSGAASLLRAAVIAGLGLAVLDILVVRKRTNKQLRMTKHEVKQENKNSEGDPLLKGAIRSKQLSMSRNRMMSEVAKADVVLVNPTHVAVALRYDPQRGAPRVVAKGAGVVARGIRERAGEHRVPMVEDVPLARALHAQCDLGQEIPADLYQAVARVLAFVMALRKRGSASGTHRVPVAAGARG